MLTIYFKDELHKTFDGFSLGGAVFYHELIKKVDSKNKILYLIDPVDIKKYEKVISFEFRLDNVKMHPVVYVRRDKILGYLLSETEDLGAIEDKKDSMRTNVAGRVISVKGNKEFKKLERTFPKNWNPDLGSRREMMERINQGTEIGRNTPIFYALASGDVVANLRHLITELKKDGMKMKDIARLFGANYKTLHFWETGKRIFDCTERLILIEEVLGLATVVYDISPRQFLYDISLYNFFLEKTQLDHFGDDKMMSIIELFENNRIEAIEKIRDALAGDYEGGYS